MADGYAKFAGIFPIERADSADDAVPMTLEEFAKADFAVEQALRFGKFEALAERLRTAETLLHIERTIAADIISGKLKRPAHRIAKEPEALRFKELFLALCVRVAMDKELPRKAAVAEVAKERGFSVSKVQKAAAKHPEMFATLLPHRK